ncbi:DNA-binding transcriptional MerR regulator [Granulicella aggregans]|uniref:DNA-binding transcriptional MerR regulator n=1 Tax=Granulicella aggregans TaxID=474949 RepID=A0A7W8E2V8_9BACT|nr:MerR family transcriptional regulator [Granulicella aggregans]MBB5056791.1 DNA-binding transcriptional MerR regulator [Granulicella aggregans]
MALRQPVRSGAKTDRTGGASKSAREIPDKLYFRIGEVAKLCEVAPYVLRFWESEFPQLKPNKGGTGQRLYRRRDVEMALRVKTLLYDEGYTIAGARQYLKGELRSKEPLAATPAPTAIAPAAEPESNDAISVKLQALRAEMQSLLALLSQQPVAKPKAAVQSIRAVKPKAVVAKPEFASLFDNLDQS